MKPASPKKRKNRVWPFTNDLISDERDQRVGHERLEQRILYSAAPVDAPTEGAEAAPESKAMEDAAHVAPASYAESEPPTDAALEPIDAAPQEGNVAEPAELSDREIEVVAKSENEADGLLDQVVFLLADEEMEAFNITAETTAEGDESSSSISGVEEALALNSLLEVAEAAKQRWLATGLSEAQVAALDAVEYRIADLPPNRVGVTEGNVITIDIDAAQRGWFIDETPLEDEEFTPTGATTFVANQGTAAARDIDLVTVVMHEQGHILGLLDQSSFDQDESLMYAYISEGQRRIAGDDQADGAVAGSLEGEHYMGTGGIIITELADPNDTDTARYVEIYNSSASAIDMTGWSLRRWTNGNSTTTTSVDLGSLGNFGPGQFATIAANGTAFLTAYGFAPTIVGGGGGPADSNGDDQVGVFDNSGTLVDIFGVPGEDGTGTAHEFEDGRAERKASSTNPSATWEEADWNVFADSGSFGPNHTNSPKDVADMDPGSWIGAFGGPVVGVTITQSDGSTDVTEGGATDTFQVVLDSAPTSNVTITITPANAETTLSAAGASGAGTLASPLVLTFTPGNATSPQTVTVTAIDDSDVEGNHTDSLTFAVASSDGNYNGLSVTPIPVNVSDNDFGPGNTSLVPANWVINEILADPDATTGDANGDGTVDTADDEFVELVYKGSEDVDISGWTVSDGFGIRHTFSPGTIVTSNQAVVIFGGGTPTGTFGGALVVTAGTLGLNNGGDTITLSDGTNSIAETYGSEGGDNTSLTRNPDLIGSFVKHDTIGGGFSPGFQNDGTTPFGSAPSTNAAPTITLNSGTSVTLDELVPDANGDAFFPGFPFDGLAPSSAIQISDTDAGTDPLTVTLTLSNNGFIGGLTGSGGAVVSLNPNEDVATITGTLTDINGTLDNGFTAFVGDPDFNNDNGGPMTLTVAVDDGNGGTASETITINVTPTNDPPVAAGLRVNYTTFEDTDLIFTSATGSALLIFDDATEAAPGSDLVNVSLSVTNGILTLGDAGAVSSVSGDGAATVSFIGTIAQVNTAVAGLVYRANSGFNGTDTLTVIIDDNGSNGQDPSVIGELDSGTATTEVTTVTATISVLPVNDAPENQLAGGTTASVTVGDTIVFSTGNGNAITVSDDAGPAEVISVTLTVGSGSLTLGNAGVVTQSGDGSGTVTLSGTVANINSALEGLTFQAPGTVGSVDLTIATSDLGTAGIVAATGSSYNIGQTQSGFNAAQVTQLNNAVARWEEVILGDLGVVTDLAITANVADLGSGGTLAQAGPTAFYSNGLPSAGELTFNSQEIGAMSDLDFFSTALHEMGHILGLGTLWEDFGLAIGAPGAVSYVGALANLAYDFVVDPDAGGAIPLEDDGGEGTADSHWDEDGSAGGAALGTELMTGFANDGVLNPLSVITVGALADLGYEVDFTAADDFSVGGSQTAAQFVDFLDGGVQTDTDIVTITVTAPADITPPAVQSIVRADSSPTGADSVGFTVTFSETVNDIEITDFALATTGTVAGTITGVSAANGTVVTVTVGSIAGDGTLGLNFVTSGDSVTDDAGNLATTGFTGEVYAIDNSAPVPVISGPTGTTTNDPFTVTVDFGEIVTGFVLGDIQVTGGTVSGFTDHSDGTFTVGIDVAADGVVTVDVSGGVAQDAAGNDNTAATQFSVTVDTTPPGAPILSPADDATTVAIDSNLVLTFAEDVTKGTTGTIEIRTGGAAIQTFAITDAAVSISGNVVTIDPADLSPGTEYSVQIAAGAIQDLAGNDYAGISDDTTWTFHTLTTGSLGDFVWYDIDGDGVQDASEPGFAGVTVNVQEFVPNGSGGFNVVNRGDLATTTAADGSFTAGNLPVDPVNGTAYRLVFSKPTDTEFTQTAQGTGEIDSNAASSGLSPTLALNPATTLVHTSIDAGLVGTLSLGGTVWNDANSDDGLKAGETGADGVTVNLYTTQDTVNPIKTTTTSGGGLYQFTDLFSSAQLATAFGAATDYVVELIPGANPLTAKAGDSDADPVTGRATITLIASEANLDAGFDVVVPASPAFVPAVEATGVSLGSDLTLTFGEDMAKGTGNIVIRSGGTVVQTIDVATTAVTIGGGVITINPPQDLAAGTVYSVQLGSGVFTDTAGNAFAGISDDTTWNFTTAPANVHLNEFHYDNAGTDVGEFVEVAGDEGTDLTGWTVLLYNGSNGTVYDTINLSGTIPDEGGGQGAVSFSRAGIQNGDPDGIALVNNLGTVVEFISYEGSFAATNGVASGLTSVDVGVSQSNSSTAAGNSIHRLSNTAGSAWTVSGDDTPGLLNGIEAVAPTVTSIVRQSPSGETTNADTVTFQVTFSEDVQNVEATDFVLTGTAGGTIETVSSAGTAATYDVVVNGIASANGTLGLGFALGQNVADLAGNALVNTTPTVSNESYTLDNVIPTVQSIALVGSYSTNAASVDFTVTFNESVSGIEVGDFVLANSGVTGNIASVSAASGNSVTVMVDAVSGNGTLGLNFSGAVSDAAGNSGSGAFTGDVYTIDQVVPTVAIARVSGSPTNADSVVFNVTFSEAVSNVTADDFLLALGGATANATVSVGDAGDGDDATYTVTVSSVAGDGTLGLDLAGAVDIQDAAGNVVSLTPTTDEVYTIDNTVPTFAIQRQDADPTNADSVIFSITFSEDVSGVDAADFALALSGTTANSTVVVGDGGDADATTYTVTVNTIAGDGTVGLDLAGGATITDAAGNAANSAPTADEVYTIDNTAPTVAFILAGSSPTNGNSVIFNVVFSEAVSQVTADDFALALSGVTAASTVVVGDGGDADAATYTVTVNTVAGVGTLGLDLVGGTDIRDTAGNIVTLTPTTDAVYTIDTVAPTVQSITRAGASPTNAASVEFTVTFSESVSDIEIADFALATTGTAVGTIASVSAASGNFVTVTVDTISGVGTLGLNFVTSGDNVVDGVGNPVATGFTGEVFTIVQGPSLSVETQVTTATSGGAQDADLADATAPDALIGEEVTYTVTVGHDAASTEDGHDLIIAGDLASSGLTLVPGSIVVTHSEDGDITGAANVTIDTSGTDGFRIEVASIEASAGSAASGDLIISGVIDGPLSGGTPKAIELYVINDIADLSVYGIGFANNGGGTDGEEFTLSGAATAGDVIYVASESPQFEAFFGFAPDFTSGSASINGDDAIELFQNGAVIDVFGDINTDGTGEPWDHVDGWAYRNSATDLGGSTFTVGDWTFSGPNALDGETSNATASTPFPTGTYTPPAGGGPANPALALGETITVTYRATVSGTAGQILTNTATVDWDDTSGSGGTAGPQQSDDANVELIPTPGFTVSQSTATVGEDGTTDSFTVVLDAAPTNEVVLTISNPDTSEVDVAPTTLTFTSADWDSAQTVTFTGVDDSFADGDRATALIISVDAAASDAAYGSVADQTVTVTTADDEVAGFRVSETIATVSEDGTVTDSFTVVLDAQPESDVVILIDNPGTDEVGATPTSLTFTSADWDTAQTVNLTGENDAFVDGDQTTLLSVRIDDANSDDAFDSLADQTVTITTTDDDTAGITVTPTTATVNENGSTSSFTVRLNARPTTDVVVTISNPDPGEVTISTTSLTFTTDDWDTAQTVTLTGVDDLINDGNQTTSLTVAVDDLASDQAFDGVVDQTVDVTTIDDDAPGFGISPADVTVTEAGGTASFTVVLSAQPATDVILAITSPDTGEVTVSSPTLTFSNSNWNDPQTITVTGVNDSLADGDQLTLVLIAVDPVASDDAYDGVASQTVTVTTSDDDLAGFTLSEDSVIVSEDGTSRTASFTVVLNAEPSDTVVLTITSTDPGEVAADLGSVTFTSANWDTPQTINLAGVDDFLDDQIQIVQVTVSVDAAASDDPFGGLADQSVSVVVSDDDIAGFTLSKTAATVSEDGTINDSFTVVLNAEPLTDVVVTIGNPGTDETNISPATLTFTSANWNVAQTVTVSGVDDVLDDDDQTTTLTIGIDDANSDSAFGSVADQTVVVTTTDDDGVGFTLGKITATVSEDGTVTDSFTVELDVEPSSEVVIVISSGDPGEVSASPTTLTFDAGNWDSPQTVTLTGVNDDVDDGDQTTNLTVRIDDANSDNAFHALADQTVVVTTTDDDVAGFTLSTTDASVSESGTTDSFTVVLNARPTSDVILTVANPGADEVAATPASLTFTPDNWDAAQTVNLTGVDDTATDGDQTTVLTIGVDPGTLDSAYGALASQTVSVLTIDDDVPGFTVSQPTATVSEDGTSELDSFSVVLTSQPTTNVVLDITSTDTGEVAASPATLTFDATNWNVAQTVSLAGVPDSLVDGDQTSDVTIAVNAGLSDDDFDSVAAQTVSVTTTDDDVAGFILEKTDASVSEAGTTDSFTVVLTAQPDNDVVLTIGNPDSGEVSTSLNTLTFTAGNWNVAQTVTLTGVDDAIDDGDQITQLTVSVDGSSDSAFTSVGDQTVAVTTTDDDTAGFTLNTNTATVAESGTTDSFTIVLDTEPTSDVVLVIGNPGTDEVSAAPTTVTFTPGNWATAQTVTLTGANDDIDDGDQLTSLTVSVDAANSDDAFDTLAAQTVVVTTTDDDTAGFTVSDFTATVSEDGTTTDSFTVELDSEPVGNVVLTLTNPDGGEVSASPTTLTFNAGNWDAPQTVTLTGVDDAIDDGDQVTNLLIAVDPTASDDAFDGVASQTIAVTTTDDDTAGFTLSKPTASVSESGTTDSFTLVLDSEPVADVTLLIANPGPDEVAVSPASVTFTASNWNVAQTVTLTGVNDPATDGDQTTVLTINATSADSTYAGLGDQPLTVTTLDNDVPGFTLSQSSATVQEDGTVGDSFTVQLNVQPTSDVVIDIANSLPAGLTVSSTSLTFTPTDWNTAQTVTLSGINDNAAAGDRSATLTLSVNDVASDDDFDAVGDQTVTVAVQGVNSAPTITASQSFTVAENSAAATSVGTIAATELDPGQALRFAITAGNQSNAFSINSSTGELTVNDASALDFETNPSFTLRIQATDDGTPALTATEDVVISLTDVNDPPQVALANVVTTLATGTDTTSPIKIADILIIDDGLGTETVQLTGPDQAAFEIVGTELFLRANTPLTAGTPFTVSISVDDSSTTPSPDSAVNLVLSVVSPTTGGGTPNPGTISPPTSPVTPSDPGQPSQSQTPQEEEVETPSPIFTTPDLIRAFVEEGLQLTTNGLFIGRIFEGQLPLLDLSSGSAFQGLGSNGGIQGNTPSGPSAPPLLSTLIAGAGVGPNQLLNLTIFDNEGAEIRSFSTVSNERGEWLIVFDPSFAFEQIQRIVIDSGDFGTFSFEVPNSLLAFDFGAALLGTDQGSLAGSVIFAESGVAIS